MAKPRYPGIEVRLRTDHPMAVVAAVRLGLRRAGAPAEEIDRFSAEALRVSEADERLRVCREWARVETHSTS